MKCNHLLWLTAVAVILTVASCGGGDDPASPPGNGGNGDDGTVTLLDASQPQDWTPSCSFCIPWERCFLSNGVFIVSDSTRYDASQRDCDSQAPLGCTWMNQTQLDFRPYDSARLQFSLHVVAYGAESHIRAILHSNVPGTPDLTLVSERFYPQTPYPWEKAYDISLENALLFREATLEIGLTHQASGSPTPTFPAECPHETSASIYGLRIVATRPGG